MINFKTNKIIVDYAHTPESISQVIKYVNPYFSKVVVLFGAGGNRDKEKRKLMGTASQLADSVIVTNDNPRNEMEANRNAMDPKKTKLKVQSNKNTGLY